MSRAFAKTVYVVSFFAGMALMLLCAALALVIPMLLAAAAMFTGLTVSRHYLRCPHCGAWPKTSTIFARYCPRCGEKLDDQTKG